jgi:hypothetical protein
MSSAAKGEDMELTKEMLEKSPKSIVTSKRLRSFNRHALPDEIKDVVAPKPVLAERKEIGDGMKNAAATTKNT